MLIGNHITNVVSEQVNIFWGITVKHRTAEKQFLEILKGAEKSFQETKMRGAHEKKNFFQSNVKGLQKH